MQLLKKNKKTVRIVCDRSEYSIERMDKCIKEALDKHPDTIQVLICDINSASLEVQHDER